MCYGQDENKLTVQKQCRNYNTTFGHSITIYDVYTFCIGSMFILRLFKTYGVFGPYLRNKFLNVIRPFDGHIPCGFLSGKKIFVFFFLFLTSSTLLYAFSKTQ